MILLFSLRYSSEAAERHVRRAFVKKATFTDSCETHRRIRSKEFPHFREVRGGAFVTADARPPQMEDLRLGPMVFDDLKVSSIRGVLYGQRTGT
jgi:hypothetical protein